MARCSGTFPRRGKAQMFRARQNVRDVGEKIGLFGSIRSAKTRCAKRS
jgi:hypothetical protein